MSSQLSTQIVILVVFIAMMYFLLIRPQRKKEKEVNDMRSGVRVGDQVVTIGGIIGKVVKTKDDSIVIQVGADKVRFEMKRWAISTVEKKSDRPVTAEEKAEASTEEKKVKPKRLGFGKKAEAEAESMEEGLKEITAEATAEAKDTVSDAVEAVEPVTEAAEIAE